ncbi:hypothetical protein HK405_004125, partial [Cladochytrium tenue]
MTRHGWKLPLLSEFYPADDRLLGLNVNAGREIRLRLRHPGDESRFFDEESVVGTMLHELSIPVRGPHDAQFYKILDDLSKEFDEIVASGWQGEGFDAPGRRVGEGASHDLPPHLARERAAKEAERRLRLSKIMGPPGGQKLGGSLSTVASKTGRRMSPAEMAALAAERRLLDSIWCGAGRDPPAEDGGEDGRDDDDDDCVLLDSEGLYEPRSSPKPWVCEVCTLINEPGAPECEACSATAPQDPLGRTKRRRTERDTRIDPRPHDVALEVVNIDDSDCEGGLPSHEGCTKWPSEPPSVACKSCTTNVDSSIIRISSPEMLEAAEEEAGSTTALNTEIDAYNHAGPSTWSCRSCSMKNESDEALCE